EVVAPLVPYQALLPAGEPVEGGVRHPRIAGPGLGDERPVLAGADDVGPGGGRVGPGDDVLATVLGEVAVLGREESFHAFVPHDPRSSAGAAIPRSVHTSGRIRHCGPVRSRFRGGPAAAGGGGGRGVGPCDSRLETRPHDRRGPLRPDAAGSTAPPRPVRWGVIPRIEALPPTPVSRARQLTRFRPDDWRRHPRAGPALACPSVSDATRTVPEVPSDDRQNPVPA